jgi:hypothetical protein
MTDETTTNETMTPADLHTARVATLRLLFADEADTAAICLTLNEAFGGRVEVDVGGAKLQVCQELDGLKNHLYTALVMLRGYT